MSARAEAPARPGGAAAASGPALAWLAAALALIYAVYGASWIIIHRDPIMSLVLKTANVTDQSDATLDKWFRIAIYGPILVLGLLGLLLFRRRPAAGRVGVPTGLAFLSGFGAMAVLVGVALISGVGTGAATPFPHIRAGLYITGTLLVLLQVCGEETLFRGVVLPVLTHAGGWRFGVLMSALGFAAVHYAGGWTNPVSLFNIFLAGVWFALLARRSGGLLAPIAAHFAYNWTEEMLFGASPNPGVGSFGSLVDVELTGPAIWGGSAEGFNASLVLTMLLLALVAVALRRGAGAGAPARTAARKTGGGPA